MLCDMSAYWGDRRIRREQKDILGGSQGNAYLIQSEGYTIRAKKAWRQWYSGAAWREGN